MEQENNTPKPQPFIIQDHDTLLTQICGKEPQTVLAIEQMLYTIRISEYTEPLSYGRHWCYETFDKALLATVEYLLDPRQSEPAGWTRATDFGEGVKGHDRHDKVRVRRRRVTIDGDSYITTDDAEL